MGGSGSLELAGLTPPPTARTLPHQEALAW